MGIRLEPRCPLQGCESVGLRQDQHEPAATAMLQPLREGKVDMTSLLRAGHDYEPLIIGEVGKVFRAMSIPRSTDADPFSEHRRRLRVNRLRSCCKLIPAQPPQSQSA